LGQLAIAAVATYVGEAGSSAGFVAFVLLAAVAWARPMPETVPVRRVWTAIVLMALVASGGRGWYGESVLDAGVDFLLLLGIQRLFIREKTREHLQLLLLGATLMTIAAVVNVELSYPLLLVLYLPTATMALVLDQLLGEGERLGPRVAWELERSVPRKLPRLWRAAAMTTVMATIFGAVVFVAFPRFGVGVFLRGRVADNPTSGFGDAVQLGGFGTIKSDPTVVLRMEPIDEAPRGGRLDWYIRGTVFDSYERGGWRHGPRADWRNSAGPPVEETTLQGARRYDVLRDARGPRAEIPRLNERTDVEIRATRIPGFAASTQAVRMRMTLEDIGTDLVLAPSEPIAIALTRRGALEARTYVAAESDGRMRIVGKAPGPVQYEIVARTTRPTREELAAVGQPRDPEALYEVYTAVPPALDERLRPLAGRLTAGATTRVEEVEAIMSHLAAFEYTLDQPPSQLAAAGADPIEGFLFETKAGHCEYFATALALLLREADIPARVVNGYYGASWNDVGGFYFSRQAEAHSWVEVYFGPLGWVVFDATPSEGRTPTEASWFPAVSRWADAMRNAYLRWIIDYDLGKQVALLEQVGVNARPEARDPVDWRRFGTFALGFLAALVIPLALWSRLRRPPQRPDSRIAARLFASFARAGYPRGAGETPLAFARRLTTEGHGAATALLAFARAFEASRFAAGERPAEDLDELAALGTAASRLARQAPRRGPAPPER
jgi:transglutaminase-like putative cysteine protease